MRKLLDYLTAKSRMPKQSPCPALPAARFVRPASWTEIDKTNLDVFLRTPSGKKFLLTLHDLTVSRALTLVDRTPYEHGITGVFSVMLSEIERLGLSIILCKRLSVLFARNYLKLLIMALWAHPVAEQCL